MLWVTVAHALSISPMSVSRKGARHARPHTCVNIATKHATMKSGAANSESAKK